MPAQVAVTGHAGAAGFGNVQSEFSALRSVEERGREGRMYSMLVCGYVQMSGEEVAATRRRGIRTVQTDIGGTVSIDACWLILWG